MGHLCHNGDDGSDLWTLDYAEFKGGLEAEDSAGEPEFREIGREKPTVAVTMLRAGF